MLAIVAICRNEADNIPRLNASIAALKAYVSFPVQTIFVDSASTDNSRELAAQEFDTVIELEESEHLCASAGRFAGTLEARYPWIFYLDADMEVSHEFFHVLENLDKLPADSIGVIGLYIHRFDNGGVVTQTFSRAPKLPAPAMQFGGAVVLRRENVVRAGNWDPSIYGKEEMELYVRLGNGKRVVTFVGIPMVNHYTEFYSRQELLLRLLLPSAGLGKVFWGYGQSLRALSIKQKLGALLRLEHEAYLFWSSVLLLLCLAVFWSPAVTIALFFVLTLSFSLWLRPGIVIRYLTLPLSFVPGWFRYFPWFRPKLLKWGSTEKTAL